MLEVFNLDLDEELLAHLVREDSWVTLQGEEFDPDLIEDPEIVQIYTWQRNHKRDHGRIATASVLADEFDLDLAEPETSIGDLLDRMRQRYMKNGGRDALRAAVLEARDGDPLLVPQILIRRGRELAHKVNARGEVFGTGDFDRAMARYDKKAEAGPGASVGFEEMDSHFNGMRGLNFLLGYKKSMKSWLMIQMAIANIEKGNYPFLYSLELPADETDMRLRFMLANIPWWKWVHNKLGPQDRKQLKEVSDDIDGLGMYKIAKPPQGRRGIVEMVNVARDAGAELVLIDQLQYVENDHGISLGRSMNTGEFFGVLDDARNLSDDGPIMIAHQFGRQAAGSESMPDISLAKGSSSIEEVCTLALGLWANKDMRKSGKLEIGTLMARNVDDWASWELDVEYKRGNHFSISRRIEDE